MEENITRQKRKKNKTHKNIMHAAKTLFDKKGIGGVTTDEISEMADISRSTFFNHFNSIDDLLFEIANQEIEDLIDIVKKEKKSGLENIELLLNTLIEDIYNYPSLSMFLLTNNILNKKNESCKQIVEIIRNDLVQEGKDKFKDFNLDELTGLLLGSVFGLLYQKFIEGTPFNDIEQQKYTICKILKLFNLEEKQNG